MSPYSLPSGGWPQGLALMAIYAGYSEVGSFQIDSIFGTIFSLLTPSLLSLAFVAGTGFSLPPGTCFEVLSLRPVEIQSILATVTELSNQPMTVWH